MVLLTPKTKLAYLDETMSIRQGLEKMRAHGYMAIPLLSKEGEYLGTVSEGDLLYYIVDGLDIRLERLEKKRLADIVRKDYTPAVKVDTDIEKVLEMVMNQNFVPVVDDRNILMGIITRKAIISHLLNSEQNK